MVRREAELALESDDEAPWAFVHTCQCRVIHGYKANMCINRNVEEARFVPHWEKGDRSLARLARLTVHRYVGAVC